MTFNPLIHHRRSIRLKGYDYSQAGVYFVTMCTQDRAPLFGEIIDGAMHLNDAGRMVWTVWDELPSHYPGVDIDAFVVMPNHVHGLVVLSGAAAVGDPGPAVGVGSSGPTVGVGPRAYPDDGHPRGDAPTTDVPPSAADAPTLSLPDVVHRFKTLTTKRYTDGVKELGWPPYPGRVWQRNYYEHIVRSEESLNRIRQYILDNPARWAMDRENPAATAPEAEGAWLA